MTRRSPSGRRSRARRFDPAVVEALLRVLPVREVHDGASVPRMS